MQLYHGTSSVCSQKVRVTFAEIGLEYESTLLDLPKGDQFDPGYLRLNPDGVVPTLIDDGLIIVESSLIAEYLDKTYNGGRLMPDDRVWEVRTRHWLLRCLAIHDAINTLTFSTGNRDKALASKTPEEIEAGIARMPNPVNRSKRRDLFAHGLNSQFVGQALRTLRRTFADMKAHAAEHGWVSGPGFGLADIGLVAYIDRIDRLGFAGLWEAEYAPVGTWLDAMRSRPSYDTAIASFIPDDAAKTQRAAGTKYWPDLAERWATADPGEQTG